VRNNTTNGPNQNINLSLLLRCANIGKSKKRIYGAYTTSDEMKLYLLSMMIMITSIWPYIYVEKAIYF